MDEVRSLASLRALILNGKNYFVQAIVIRFEKKNLQELDFLNLPSYSPIADNDISSVCNLDQMKELNTLGTCSEFLCIHENFGLHMVLLNKDLTSD